MYQSPKNILWQVIAKLSFQKLDCILYVRVSYKRASTVCKNAYDNITLHQK